MALEAGASQAEAVVIDGTQRPDPLRQQRDPPERGRGRHRGQPALRRWQAHRRRLGQPLRRRRALRRLAAVGRRDRPSAARAGVVPLAARARPGAAGRGRLGSGDGRGRPRAARRCRGAVIAAARRRRGTGLRTASRPSAETISVVNSLGIRVSEPRSRGQVLTVMMGPGGGTGYAEQVAVDIDAIDASAIGREAAERTAAMTDPIELPPATTRSCSTATRSWTSPLWLGLLGFGAQDVQEQQSFFEPGKVVASPLVSLADDGTDPAGTPASFDYEGVAKQRVPLLERGRLPRGRPRHPDRRARRRRRSTGHGLPAPNPWGPFPLNLLDGGRRDAARRAHRRPRARPAGDALPLHQRGPPQAGHDHRHDQGRALPRRGRADHGAGAQPALHAELPRCARRGGGGQRRATRGRRRRLPRHHRRAGAAHRRRSASRARPSTRHRGSG